MSDNQPLVINGWSIFLHPLLLDECEKLLTQVEILRQRNPQNYQKKNVTKRLTAIRKLVFEVIPQNPTRNEYRQGVALSEDYKHWFRAKFFKQYRLFFRYHQASKIIIFAWVSICWSLVGASLWGAVLVGAGRLLPLLRGSWDCRRLIWDWSDRTWDSSRLIRGLTKDDAPTGLSHRLSSTTMARQNHARGLKKDFIVLMAWAQIHSSFGVLSWFRKEQNPKVPSE